MLAQLCLGVLTVVQVVTAECKFKGNDDYARYKPGTEVELHADTTKKMPNDGEESSWEDWALDVVIPVAVLFCLCGCCFGCFLCRYNCKMKKRLNKGGFLVPSEKWAYGESRRTCGWVLLAITLFVLAFTMSYGMTQRNKFVNDVRTIPDVLTVYSSYLRDDVVPELRCIANETTIVIDTANRLGQCLPGGNNADIDNIVGQANRILSDTGLDSAIKVFNDLADDIDKISRDAHLDEEADDTREGIDVFVGLAAIVVAANFVIGYLAAKKDNWKDKLQTICCANECMCSCFFAFVFVVCISLILLRAVASFCIDPNNLMIEINDADIDSRARFYLVCDSYSRAEKVQNFPWTPEKQSTSSAFRQIQQSAAQLSSIAATARCTPQYQSLQNSIGGLSDDFTNTTGVFGVNGPLGCSLTARFIQAIYILVCDEMYVPLDQMVWCLAIGAAAMAALTFLNTCMRRESGSTHVRFENVNPAFVPSVSDVRQPNQDFNGSQQKGVAMNPVVEYPPAYQDATANSSPALNVVPGHAASEAQASPYEDDETIA